MNTPARKSSLVTLVASMTTAIALLLGGCSSNDAASPAAPAAQTGDADADARAVARQARADAMRARMDKMRGRIAKLEKAKQDKPTTGRKPSRKPRKPTSTTGGDDGGGTSIGPIVIDKDCVAGPLCVK